MLFKISWQKWWENYKTDIAYFYHESLVSNSFSPARIFFHIWTYLWKYSMKYVVFWVISKNEEIHFGGPVIFFRGPKFEKKNTGGTSPYSWEEEMLVQTFVKVFIFSHTLPKNGFELMVKLGFLPFWAATASPYIFGGPIFSFFD